MSEMRLAKSRVHFIGIGGIGMCGLAELLHNMGVQVKGSDLNENDQTLRLKSLGIPVSIGHNADLIENVDVAVYSSAIPTTNVEFKACKDKSIPLIPRAEALAEIMRLKRGVAVAGTHGKTTTTSLAASVFLNANLDPTIVVGGRLDLIKSTAQLGLGDWLVAEADESDGSFDRLSPEIVIITNIDNDHLDHYGEFKNLQKAFFRFAERIPFYGAAIVCGDDEDTYQLFENFNKKVVFYGFHERNDFTLNKSSDGYEVYRRGELLGEMQVTLPGKHNALNALASVIAGLAANIDAEVCLAGIGKFEGVGRRFEYKGQKDSIDVYDDYGHHPTEVAAVLDAMKEKYPDRRLVVLFQPHRYSRTEQCWNEFLGCFKQADQVFMLDIYPAGEKPIDKITAARLAGEVDHNKCEYLGDKESAKEAMATRLNQGDILLTLGAGDVYKLGEEYLGK